MRVGHWFWSRRRLVFWSRISWISMSILALVALVLGWEGFRQLTLSRGESRTFQDLLYLSLQLFTLESGSVWGAVPLQLEVARLLAPLVAAWAVVKALVSLFHEQLKSFKVRRLKQHVVVCGLGRRGLELADMFLKRGYNVVVVESDEDNDRLLTCHNLGIPVVLGDATEGTVLQNASADRAAHVFAITGDDGANLAIAVALRQTLKQSKRNAGTRLMCHAHLVDLDLCALLQQNPLFTEDGDQFKARVFNIFDNAARLTLMNHPLEDTSSQTGKTRRMHLVIVGFGRMGASIAIQAAKIGHYADGLKPRITVLDKNIDLVREAFLGCYPHFGSACEAQFIQGDIERREIQDQIIAWIDDPDSKTTVAFCLDDDPSNLRNGLHLSARLGSQDTTFLIRMTESDGLATLISNEKQGSACLSRLQPFGLLGETCRLEVLLEDDLDRLAAAIHRRYVEERSKEGTPPDEATQPWDSLAPVFKDSNRQSADHIAIQLRAIGCFVAEAGDGKARVTRFEPHELERMAKMEHERWCAERRLLGWSKGPRDNRKLTRPDLVAWDDLTEEMKEKNQRAVSRISELLGGVGLGVYRV